MSSGTWSYDYFTNGDPSLPPTAANGTWTDPTGETAGGNASGGQYAVDAMTSGSVTATITWVPATNMTIQQDPPSSQVIVEEIAEADATGGINNGADDTWSNGIGTDNVDTRYVVEDGSSGVIKVTDSLSASTPGAGPPPYRFGSAEVAVSFSVVANPVEVDLSGTTLDGNTLDILTGQQVKATLAAPYTVKSYSWSTASADAFKNYDPTLTANQLVALTATDENTAGFNFYTKSAGSAKVTCTATVLCPDNVTRPVTASRDLNSVKPTATVTIDPAGGPLSPYGVGSSNGQGAAIGCQIGWWPATITVPAPFIGGAGGFAQLTSPTVTNTRNPNPGFPPTYTLQIPDGKGGWTVMNNALDAGFPFAYGYIMQGTNWVQGPDPYTWDAGGSKGYSGDGPTAPANIDAEDGGGNVWTEVNANESFQTWVMYQPPQAIGNQLTVWVPLMKWIWSWSADMTGLNANWTRNVADDKFTTGEPIATDTPPIWDQTTANRAMEPG